MEYLFIEYPPCSTCRNAKKHLNKMGIQYKARHIVEDPPTIKELNDWLILSELDIKKFFNTSGNVYKELHLKDKLDSMTTDEKISLLASNGMLIKRPLLISKEKVILGYNQDTYDKVR
ncbi:MAG: arsenate reductase family protein [Erysipelotrichaceae bacterium]